MALERKGPFSKDALEAVACFPVIRLRPFHDGLAVYTLMYTSNHSSSLAGASKVSFTP